MAGAFGGCVEVSARGVFVTFEGGEGCGKSTQLELLAGELRRAGARVTTVREPGATRVGELVRGALLDPAHGEMAPRAELLLYEASRAQLVTERIAPALADGEIVLCDRFFDSTTAYQGYGRGLPLDQVEALNLIATDGLVPDLTLVLDIEPSRGLARATAAGADRLEAEELAFHERVREGFLAIAASEPDRVAVIDAAGSVDEVAERIVRAAKRLPALEALLGGRA